MILQEEQVVQCTELSSTELSNHFPSSEFILKMTDKKDHPQLGKNKACQSHVGRYPDLFWCQSSAQGCRMFFHQLKPITKGLGTWLGEQSVCSTTWVQSLESTWKKWVWWCAIVTLTLVRKGHGDLWGSLASWPRLMSKYPSYWDTTSQKEVYHA